MDRNFVFPGLTTRVVFGRGRVSQVADEVRRLGRKRPLVLCTPGPGLWRWRRQGHLPGR